MKHKRCHTTGKVSYKNAADAKKSMAYQNKTFNGCETELVDHLRAPYRCAYCHRWHLTRLSPDESAALTAHLAPFRVRA